MESYKYSLLIDISNNAYDKSVFKILQFIVSDSNVNNSKCYRFFTFVLRLNVALKYQISNKTIFFFFKSFFLLFKITVHVQYYIGFRCSPQ